LRSLVAAGVVGRPSLGAIAPQFGAEPSAFLVARHLEALARIAVRATGAPPGGAALGAVSLARRNRVTLLFGRFPQTTAREPQHDGVGMPRLELTQRRHQLIARVRAEGGRLAFENDGPVRVARWHG
jgi:hypothetical protein